MIVLLTNLVRAVIVSRPQTCLRARIAVLRSFVPVRLRRAACFETRVTDLHTCTGHVPAHVRVDLQVTLFVSSCPKPTPYELITR
jgi:hypothetical protein